MMAETASEILGCAFASYPDRKAVDLPWIDAIPAEWSLPKLRFVTRVNPPKSELDPSLEDDEPVSFVPMEAIGRGGPLELMHERPLSSVQDQYTYFEDGDVLIAKITPCFENGKGALAVDLTSGIGFGTTELHVLRPGAGIDGRFLYYLTQSHHFRRIGEHAMYGAGGQKRISTDFVEQFEHPVPPLKDQQAIANFLDGKILRIDKLIDRKKRLVELLKEKRTALISRAVTKGLDPGVRMKDSGVEWLGQIPEHWEKTSLRHVTECLDSQRIPLNSEERSSRPGPYPYWGANSVVDHIDDWLFDEPLVLVGEDGAPFFDRGRPVAFAVSGKIWVNNHAHVLRPKASISQQFLTHVLNAVEYGAFIGGSTRDKLTQSDMNAIPVQLPPVSEQREICDYISSTLAKPRELVRATDRSIELLDEYRTALILSVVTGRINVCDRAA